MVLNHRAGYDRKDEEDQLADCLASVKDIVTEICIVDTGSSDYTLEIAQFNAKIGVYIWSDDFPPCATNRCACVRRTGYRTDADERIAPDDFVPNQGLAKGARLLLPFHHAQLHQQSPSPTFQPCEPSDLNTKVRLLVPMPNRFFPNRRGGKFQGKVHELSTSRWNNRECVLDCPVLVHHYPLLKTRTAYAKSKNGI